MVSVPRLILIVFALPIVAAVFLYLAHKILKRSKQRLSKIFSMFYIFTAIANIVNIIYAPMPHDWLILIIILHVITLFSIFFSLIFVLVSNLIIISSTVIFTVEKQNRIIYIYALLLAGMVAFVPFGFIDINDDGFPVWNPIFFIYVFSVFTCIAVIPVLYTSKTIYKSFQNKMLRKKWQLFIIGLIGLLILFYGIMVANLLNFEIVRLFNSIYSFTIIVWNLMIYYGIGRQIKE